MSEPEFQIKWSGYESVFSQNMIDAREGHRFTDVTICATDATIFAHKLVLSCGSAFFSDLLARYPPLSPVIIVLKDAIGAELELLLEYIYRGVVDCPQRSLKGLIGLARILRVTGLSELSEHGGNDLQHDQNMQTDPDELSPIPQTVSSATQGHSFGSYSERDVDEVSEDDACQERDPLDLSLVSQADRKGRLEIPASNVPSKKAETPPYLYGKRSRPPPPLVSPLTPIAPKPMSPSSAAFIRSAPTFRLLSLPTKFVSLQETPPGSMGLPVSRHQHTFRLPSSSAQTTLRPYSLKRQRISDPGPFPLDPPVTSRRKLLRQSAVSKRDEGLEHSLSASSRRAQPPPAIVVTSEDIDDARTEPSGSNPSSLNVDESQPSSPHPRTPLIRSHSSPTCQDRDPVKEEAPPQQEHVPHSRSSAPVGCDFCWKKEDGGRSGLSRRKTRYQCLACGVNLCIVPCFQEYHSARLNAAPPPAHSRTLTVGSKSNTFPGSANVLHVPRHEQALAKTRSL